MVAGSLTCAPTPAAGRGLLQGALIAREFHDVHRLVRPPRPVQRLVFATPAPVARKPGLRGLYPEYLTRVTATVDELEPLPPFAV
ncbi:hypothetical protein [Dactylosporangium sp. CS-033363]|uniref:hypothetical protein n=1 Tax=Dactylosporangium sp. CS-033363 TaxID=3239935 RepID=UPI003D910028